MSVLGQAIITSSASVLNLAVRVLALSVLARLLQPEQFGWIGISLAVTAIVADVAQLDLRDAIIRRQRIWRQHVVIAGIVLVVSSLAWVAILNAVAGSVSQWFGMPQVAALLSVMATMLLFDSLAVIPEAMLIRNRKVKQVAIADVASYAFFFTPTAIWLALEGWNEWALAIAYIARSAGYFLMTSGLAFSARAFTVPRAGKASRSLLLRSLFQNSGLGTANRVLTQGSRNIDNLVVGGFLGARDLGVYTRSYTLAATPIDALLAMTIRSALFPAFARVQNNAGKLADAVNRAISGALLIMVPISAAGVGLAPSLVLTVIGPQWVDAILPFQCIMAAMAVRFAPKLAAALARATSHVGMAFSANLASTLVLGLAVGIGSRFGLPGAALGFLTAAVFQWGLSVIIMARLSGQTVLQIILLHVPYIWLSTLVILVFFGIESFVSLAMQTPYLTFLSSAFVGSVIIGICVLVAPGVLLGRTGRHLLLTLIKIILGRIGMLRSLLRFFEHRLGV